MIEDATAISISHDYGICVFVAAGSYHDPLRSAGFTGAIWDGFGYNMGNNPFSELATYCKSGVSYVTLPPIPEGGAAHGICTL